MWIRELGVRGIVAGAAGAVCVVVVAIAWFRGDEPRRVAPSRNDGWSTPDSEWTSTNEASVVAGRVAVIGRQQWIQAGLGLDTAHRLERDVAAILAAIFEPNFDTYDEVMYRKGLALDAMAPAYCEAMVEWKLYSRDDLPVDMTTRDKVRHLWNNPARRNTEWHSVRLPSVRAGFGLVHEAETVEWPYAGAYSQLSLYAPLAGRLTVAEGMRINTTKESAWIMMEGRFASGMRTHIKINWYYDENGAGWVPITIVFGTDGAHRPFPML